MLEIHFPVVGVPHRSSHLVASCLTAFSVGWKDWATGHGESCDIEVYISSGIAFSRLFTSETHQILDYCESPHLGLITRGPLLAWTQYQINWYPAEVWFFFPQAVEGNEWVFCPLSWYWNSHKKVLRKSFSCTKQQKALWFFKGQVTGRSYFPERCIVSERVTLAHQPSPRSHLRLVIS